MGFSSKTKARGVIGDIIHLLVEGGRRTGGLTESKYGYKYCWEFISVALKTLCTPDFTVFDSSLCIYARIECRWEAITSKKSSLQPLQGCSTAAPSHFVLAKRSVAGTNINTFL